MLEHRKFRLHIMENFLDYYEGCQTLEQDAHGSCDISILGDSQNLMEQGPEQHSLTYSALSRRLD